MTNEQGAQLSEGSIVQIDPAHDERFGGCFLHVTEVKSWGVQGFVKIPAGGDAYYRVAWEHIEYIGEAAWVPSSEPTTEDETNG